ncbi:MAG: hypothetical protein JO257_34875 [Deltaproteobacteria bacterium]|nr:hypothetical protein [Deltaproteobacteria bacterium]
MKSAVLCVVAAAACGPGIAQIPHDARDQTQQAGAALASASQAADVATLRRMLGPTVVNGGLWFADPTCEAEFAVPGEVGGGRLDELARCLATLKLRTGARADALPDVAVLSYDPGFELEAQFIERPDGAWLSWIGWVARHDTADALPTITPDALESLRVAGSREPVVSGLEASIAASKRKYAYAWTKLCIDAEGNVTGAHVRQASSTRALHAFSDAIDDWKFKPFTPKGQPLPVCSMMLLGTPLSLAFANEKIPMPMTGDKPPVDPDTLERISGDRFIVPDDDDKSRIQKAGSPRMIGAFKVCLDTSGHVEDVQILHPTGLATYDARIIAGIKHWQYKPFLDDGEPKAVCTAVSFIYSQQ